MIELKKYIQKIPSSTWILIAIILVGIFLRTYHFHDWLLFESDQARDATLVSDVVDGHVAWPQFGPTMRKSGISEDNLFHLGPIYYYFQILSAKIFGSAPDKMAYPDVLFSMLSIPLLYFFLRRYFDIDLSLVLVGIYAVSFFSIQYARFAWNSNLIPFFVILFLLSLHEFLVKREKTNWIWPVLLGIAIGVGIQLHAIMIVLFGLVTFFVFVFLMKKNWRVWNKLLLVVAVIGIINSGQIINDAKNNFSNAKIFFNFPVNPSNNPNKFEEFFVNLKDDVGCHMEANTYMLMSYSGTNSFSAGSASCSYLYSKPFENNKIMKLLGKTDFWLWILPGFLFSFVSFIFLLQIFFQEKNEQKKYFLGLVILYVAASVVVMLPVYNSGFKEFRYSIHIFFVPIILLGVLVNFLKQKFPKIQPMAIFIIFTLIIVSNLVSIGSSADAFYTNMTNSSNKVVLGEAESMITYLNTGNQEVYLMGENGFKANFFKPLEYLAKRQNFNIIDTGSVTEAVPLDRSLFYIDKNEKNISNITEIGGRKIVEHRVFGQVVIYKLDN